MSSISGSMQRSQSCNNVIADVRRIRAQLAPVNWQSQQARAVVDHYLATKGPGHALDAGARLLQAASAESPSFHRFFLRRALAPSLRHASPPFANATELAERLLIEQAAVQEYVQNMQDSGRMGGVPPEAWRQLGEELAVFMRKSGVSEIKAFGCAAALSADALAELTRFMTTRHGWAYFRRWGQVVSDCRTRLANTPGQFDQVVAHDAADEPHAEISAELAASVSAILFLERPGAMASLRAGEPGKMRAFVDSVAAAFTEEEVDGILEFLRSPLGVRYLAARARVTASAYEAFTGLSHCGQPLVVLFSLLKHVFKRYHELFEAAGYSPTMVRLLPRLKAVDIYGP